MRRKYYKAVMKKPDGKLKSLVIHSQEWCKTYIPNKWVKAKEGTLLFVFTTKAEAFSFRSTDSKREKEVWRCEVKKSKKLEAVCVHYMSCHFSSWWKGAKDMTDMNSHFIPEKTRGCEEVKLLSKVMK